MSTLDEQITGQAEELGRMLARASGFFDVSRAIARGYGEGYPVKGEATLFVQILAADALVSGASAVRAMLVEQARDAGLSWSVIGDALGISKQAAQQRYGSR